MKFFRGKRPVLVTGFEPFGGERVNASQQVAEAFRGGKVRGHDIEVLVLPCVFTEAPARLRKLGDALVCPEMRDGYLHPERQTHCGSCGQCWTGAPTPIVFVLH